MHNTKRSFNDKYIYILFLLAFLPTYIFANNSPIAAQELVVIKNNSVIFDVSEEDKDIEEFGILTEATFGTLEIHPDNTITYKPNKDICEEMDFFQYYFKHTEGVDTLTVNVEILCESITVISGFSPTGLEDPTSFTILGVENYPDNKLYVFNELGNQVFFKKIIAMIGRAIMAASRFPKTSLIIMYSITEWAKRLQVMCE